MEYKFNEDQIFIIKWCLEIQESIWSKSKSSREYYDADLSRLNLYSILFFTFLYFDALDLVRTQNKARLHEKKISDQKKKHELFIDARNKLDKLANAYNKADDQGIKEVYKNKWLELVKIYANKI